MEEKSHLLQILPFPKRKAQKRKEWQVVSSQLGPNWAVLHAGKVCLFSTQNIQGSTPFNSVTVAFTQKGWRQLAPTPRDRFKKGMPEKSRNLVLLGLPVSQPGMNSQLEQREGSWMLEREGLRSTCPAPEEPHWGEAI
ncbi:zinc finger protein 79 isoform X3 [Globicephala melas]|uniref:zinc finger protein 79 isoform X3 n=1 Tax=Globicephala melas TaxID=9731 RepID=UPI003873B57D